MDSVHRQALLDVGLDPDAAGPGCPAANSDLLVCFGISRRYGSTALIHKVVAVDRVESPTYLGSCRWDDPRQLTPITPDHATPAFIATFLRYFYDLLAD